MNGGTNHTGCRVRGVNLLPGGVNLLLVIRTRFRVGQGPLADAKGVELLDGLGRLFNGAELESDLLVVFLLALDCDAHGAVELPRAVVVLRRAGEVVASGAHGDTGHATQGHHAHLCGWSPGLTEPASDGTRERLRRGLALLPVQRHGELVVTDEVADELQVGRDHLAGVVHHALDTGARALLEGDDFLLLFRGVVVRGRGALLVVAVLAVLFLRPGPSR